MSALDWVFVSFFFAIYVFLLFTVCVLTFQKRYFVPFLWLIGAILPAKRGSAYQIAEDRRWQRYQT